ncbi:uncharacterized protein LOC133299632 [Gastrolobium bilobum]|uniref:uncharacterized protein LOC133299632 n=1 Tax=Gastrolobium bilobum TaxID=150636 RepID=UPI002AB0FC52|nr:uncharacterized protein LOC133299632 [Gastrolobium bilobum]
MRSPWRNALIVKLLGKKVGVMYMKIKLESLWAKSGSIVVADLGNDFFSVKFANLEDLSIALTGGPWVLMGHYLAIRKWEPGFNPHKANIHRVAAWIRLPGIPQEFCEYPFLNHLGNIIGKVIKVDKNTSTGERGKFARVCVDLDLSKPLRGEYFLEDDTFKVEYEGLYLICLKCGRYGHNVDNYPECVKPANVNIVPDNRKEVSENPLMNQGVGPWMVVQRRKQKNQFASSKGSSGPRKGRGSEQVRELNQKPALVVGNQKPKENKSYSSQQSSLAGRVYKPVNVHTKKKGSSAKGNESKQKEETIAAFVFNSEASCSGSKGTAKVETPMAKGRLRVVKGKSPKVTPVTACGSEFESSAIVKECISTSTLGQPSEDSSKSLIKSDQENSSVLVSGEFLDEAVPLDLIMRSVSPSVEAMAGMALREGEDPLSFDLMMEITQELSNPGDNMVSQ